MIRPKNLIKKAYVLETQLIRIALALIGGLMLSRLTKLLGSARGDRIPAVRLADGTLFDRCADGARSRLPFTCTSRGPEHPDPMCLGFIAFAMGNEFHLSQLRSICSYADGGPAVQSPWPLTKAADAVVAIDDAVGLLLFSVSLGIANTISSGVINMISMVVEPLVEIVLSVVLGGLMGWLFHFAEHFSIPAVSE